MKTSSRMLHYSSVTLLLQQLSFGQASFELDNKHGTLVDAPVFDAEGVPLAGTNYWAELWGNATPNTLAPLQVIDEGPAHREIVPFMTSGYFFSGEDALSVLTVPPGGWAWLQVRAWDARLGATYEEVVARGIGGYGESPLFYARGANPFREPPELPGLLIGLQSFSLRPVIPEPSTWALLAAGGMALWWARRRRAGRDNLIH